MSPTLVRTFGVKSSRMRQTMRKASPMFLLAAPCQVSTMLCTISATWFTNTMTLSCNTSVVSVKFRMSQKPKTASTLLPGIMALTVALSSSIFFPMISEPASPKPSASNLPSLMMAFSRIFVSKVCTFSFLFRHQYFPPNHDLSRWRGFPSCSCFSRYVSSPSFIAYSGLSRIFSTLEIILSMGCSTRTFASWLKTMAPAARIAQMKTVWRMLYTADLSIHGLKSNTRMIMGVWLTSTSLGITRLCSSRRSLEGQESCGSFRMAVYRYSSALSTHSLRFPVSMCCLLCKGSSPGGTRAEANR
mmetsp:Transcript_14587/g.41797  ORF Transcript_14587/g.41797 Transcript_14587/m.41797 type:complete len:302 (-) Transcript_14587:1152-2057(-)